MEQKGTLTLQGDLKSRKNIEALNLIYNHLGVNPNEVILKEIPLPKRNINWKLNKNDLIFMFSIFLILGGITGLIIGAIIGKTITYLIAGILLGAFLTLVFIFGKLYYKEEGTLQIGRRNPPIEHKFIVYEKKQN